MKRRLRHANGSDTKITRLNIAKAQAKRAKDGLEHLTVEELVLAFVFNHKRRHIERASRLMATH